MYLLAFLFALFAFANCCTSADRALVTFEPKVPIVYLHNIHEENVSALELQPTITSSDSHQIALNIADQLIAPATYIVKNSYETESNGVRHVYLRQTYKDFEIFNADMNINIWNGKALSVGISFYQGPLPTTTYPTISVFGALDALAQHLNLINETGVAVTYESRSVIDESQSIIQHTVHEITGFPKAISDAKVKLGFLQVNGGENLELVWDVEVDLYDNWINAHVSATSGEVLSLLDWVADASYNVYPVGVNDPLDGNRAVLVNPAVSNASPLGWHDQGDGKTYTNTIGNNVYAQENLSGGTSWLNNGRPPGGSTLDFNFPIALTGAPRTYLNASTSNLFFWNNIIHDIFWQYGFNEVAGNFQENNFGRGGLGADAVQANCQDGSGTNNANFATPVDGQRPRMRMYTWTRSTPNRDGDLEAGIIVHEYAHGISNRLTGGPSNVNCLGSGEAGGMGEGWGDFFGTALRQRASYTRSRAFDMGGYSNNNPGVGIRKFPYTTDMTRNPETYAYINRAGYEGVHAKGEVWCGILWEAYWNFVDAYGFSDNWYLGEGGNNKILKDVVQGMKLQPCRPNFVQARDAILQADQTNYNGANTCLLWKAFAKRGLGLYAVGGTTTTPTVTESFVVPSNCA